MVDILLATYNGEKYISEQIESILKQDYQEWTLYIRDDGSTDKTGSILKTYSEKYRDKIILINDNMKNLGPKLNFNELLKYSKGKYCMFCDQDDIWMENKISITLKNMIEIEDKVGINTPILVHTDLVVVNQNLETINESYWKFSNINPNRNKINYLLLENTVTGCTMMINKKLRSIGDKMPKEIHMHDWWFSMVASLIGEICIVDKATILYRQHDNNQIGARKKSFLEKINNKKIELELNQARLVKEELKQFITGSQQKILDDFYELDKKSFLGKRCSIIKNRFYSNKILRNIKIFLMI